jgi:hypothetical protein
VWTLANRDTMVGTVAARNSKYASCRASATASTFHADVANSKFGDRSVNRLLQ